METVPTLEPPTGQSAYLAVREQRALAKWRGWWRLPGHPPGPRGRGSVCLLLWLSHGAGPTGGAGSMRAFANFSVWVRPLRSLGRAPVGEGPLGSHCCVRGGSRILLEMLTGEDQGVGDFTLPLGRGACCPLLGTLEYPPGARQWGPCGLRIIARLLRPICSQTVVTGSMPAVTWNYSRFRNHPCVWGCSLVLGHLLSLKEA